MSPLGGFGGGLFGPDALTFQSKGLEKLGGARATAGTETVLDTGTFAPRDVLFGFGTVTGLSTADVLALRFNGSAGTAYLDRNFQAQGGLTGLANIAYTSQARMRLGYHRTDFEVDTGTTTARCFYFSMGNRALTTKAAFWQVARATGAGSTLGVFTMGQGEWVEGTVQVNRIELLTLGGTAQFTAGSFISIHGSDYP